MQTPPDGGSSPHNRVDVVAPSRGAISPGPAENLYHRASDQTIYFGDDFSTPPPPMTIVRQFVRGVPVGSVYGGGSEEASSWSQEVYSQEERSREQGEEDPVSKLDRPVNLKALSLLVSQVFKSGTEEPSGTTTAGKQDAVENSVHDDAASAQHEGDDYDTSELGAQQHDTSELFTPSVLDCGNPDFPQLSAMQNTKVPILNGRLSQQAVRTAPDGERMITYGLTPDDRLGSWPRVAASPAFGDCTADFGLDHSEDRAMAAVDGARGLEEPTTRVRIAQGAAEDGRRQDPHHTGDGHLHHAGQPYDCPPGEQEITTDGAPTLFLPFVGGQGERPVSARSGARSVRSVATVDAYGGGAGSHVPSLRDAATVGGGGLDSRAV